MHSGCLLSCDLLGDELCDCRRSIAGCAAAEAAGGLYLHLLLGEGTTQILEGFLCFLGRAVGGMLSGSSVEARNGNANNGNGAERREGSSRGRNNNRNRRRPNNDRPRGEGGSNGNGNNGGNGANE